MIQIRHFEPEQDYDSIKEWWVGHGWPSVPKEILPKLGIVAHIGDQDIAACWLYMDNSIGVSMLEWTVSNPKATGRQVLGAITLMTDFMTGRARDMDYGVMLTSTRTTGLIRAFERVGFKKTDAGLTHMLKLTRKEDE